MRNINSYREIWRISYPIILGSVAQNIVNVTDTIFLGRLGVVALGAAGNAGIFYFVLMVVGLGFSVGKQIIIGRRNGENNHAAIGDLITQGVYFLLPLATLGFLFMQYLSPFILREVTASEEILNATIDFLKYRSFGVFFAFFNYLFIGFYTGITQTKVLTYTTVVQGIVNIIFDYLLIFGHFGFPEMGITGAATASVISEIAAVSFFIVYTKKHINFSHYQLLESLKFKSSKLLRMLKISAPIMLQNFMSIASWLVFFMIIEQIGQTELAASHIVRSIYMVLMIPLFGFSSATSTLVSNLIGSNKVNQVLSLTKKVLLLSLSLTALFTPITLLFPNHLGSIYTNQNEVIEAVKSLLYVISFSMLFFSVAMILFSAVTGTGKTVYSLAIEIISIAIYLSVAYIIGVHFKMDLWLVWCSEFIYFGVMASLAGLYLKFGNWKSAKV